MQGYVPEAMVRTIVDACTDCDICRYLMEDTPCLVFPELYRLYDKEAGKRGSITPGELRNLVDLCNFCGLCPCPNVRSDLMKAKHAFVLREGLKPTIRILEDVEFVAKVCGAFPRLANLFFQRGLTGHILKNLAGIHTKRNVPLFPKESFPAWAEMRGLHIRRGGNGRKVAYFAGCTGQYLFPDVPKAVVEVLQRNEIEVYYPEQKCCGMPALLEGDRVFAFELAAFNANRLTEAVEAGYDIVCSCPTCGYMLKNVLGEGACYSAEYRKSFSPADSSKDVEASSSTDRPSLTLPGKLIFEGLFRDDGYFASIDPRKRMKIASHTYDLGEYLRSLGHTGELNTELGPVSERMAYYPPCHLREQNIGEPYSDLLSLVPGIRVEKIGGSFYCCGIAGIMGFKRDFHEVSLKMGRQLMEKIEDIRPQKLLTDCLSCRLQFNQLTPYKVFHPVEILMEAYAGYRNI